MFGFQQEVIDSFLTETGEEQDRPTRAYHAVEFQSGDRHYNFSIKVDDMLNSEDEYPNADWSVEFAVDSFSIKDHSEAKTYEEFQEFQKHIVCVYEKEIAVDKVEDITKVAIDLKNEFVETLLLQGLTKLNDHKYHYKLMNNEN